MGKRLTVLLAGIILAFVPVSASANPSAPTPFGILAVLGLPGLMIFITAVSGGAAIMAGKGVKPTRWWEYFLGFLLLFFFGSAMAFVFIPFISMYTIARGIQLIIWGAQARRPVEKRPEYLARADSRKLVSGGAILIAGTIFLGSVGLVASFSEMGYSELIRKSNEGATKGNVGSIRAALAIYYGDTEGLYPESLDPLTSGGKYLETIPQVKVPPHHPDSSNYVGHLLYKDIRPKYGATASIMTE